ncbi:MAG TPA: hypothetical protein ENH55_13700 [Aurantimonas coralicida]|jgi:hypothetical protein|uniref:Uncharacterized protein n=2 Tax=root TaxID=1 RepID=A0A9C9NIY8_9HYPH|nr:hypothetical protein [Aurantimonas coralicida]HEU02230.1 hypothetical protein [Aurantimonas coralicida]|tara:strand:- start:110 stop:388 length:279 start_codon:yes stop_codon:yes gene_type:complete
MSKGKASADFLSKMSIGQEEPTAKSAPTQAEKAMPVSGRSGLKHIGGYFDRDMVEKVALLRARLALDNSQLIKRAVEELYGREIAARKFGDR